MSANPRTRIAAKGETREQKVFSSCSAHLEHAPCKSDRKDGKDDTDDEPRTESERTRLRRVETREVFERIAACYPRVDVRDMLSVGELAFQVVSDRNVGKSVRHVERHAGMQLHGHRIHGKRRVRETGVRSVYAPRKRSFVRSRPRVHNRLEDLRTVVGDARNGAVLVHGAIYLQRFDFRACRSAVYYLDVACRARREHMGENV